jgi:hypothetical protein
VEVFLCSYGYIDVINAMLDLSISFFTDDGRGGSRRQLRHADARLALEIYGHVPGDNSDFATELVESESRVNFRSAARDLKVLIKYHLSRKMRAKTIYARSPMSTQKTGQWGSRENRPTIEPRTLTLGKLGWPLRASQWCTS